MEKLALILAAGEGTRMLSSTPKTLHKICGVPIVEHVLRALGQITNDIYIIVGHGKEQVMDSCHGQGTFVEQKSGGWGTGYAVLSAIEHLQGRKGQVLVTAGDMPLVLPETFARLMNEVEAGSACAMLTDYVDNPVGYGRVVRENGKVARIVEQKDLVGDQHSIKEMNASVYCFDIESLLWALPKLSDKNAANEYYLTDVVGVLYENGKSITAVPVLEKSECLGINDRVQLAQAETAMRRRINIRHMRAGVTMADPESTYIHTDVTIGQDTVLHPGCSIEKGSSIGSGCTLRASRVSGSHIGDGTKIEQSVIIDAFIGNNQKIGPFEYVRPGRKISGAKL